MVCSRHDIASSTPVTFRGTARGIYSSYCIIWRVSNPLNTILSQFNAFDVQRVGTWYVVVIWYCIIWRVSNPLNTILRQLNAFPVQRDGWCGTHPAARDSIAPNGKSKESLAFLLTALCPVLTHSKVTKVLPHLTCQFMLGPRTHVSLRGLSMLTGSNPERSCKNRKE